MLSVTDFLFEIFCFVLVHTQVSTRDSFVVLVLTLYSIITSGSIKEHKLLNEQHSAVRSNILHFRFSGFLLILENH